VLAVMNKQFKLISDDNEQLISALDKAPHNTIVQYSMDTDGVNKYSLVEHDKGENTEAMCLSFMPMQGVNFQATLAEVYNLLEINRNGAVYIFANTAEEIVGIITWKTLRYHLHKARY
jgi:CIC family chloride channel protein